MRRQRRHAIDVSCLVNTDLRYHVPWWKQMEVSECDTASPQLEGICTRAMRAGTRSPAVIMLSSAATSMSPLSSSAMTSMTAPDRLATYVQP